MTRHVPSPFLFRFLACCLPLLALGGCTVNPATGEQTFTAFMSPDKELAVGREEHPKLVKQFGGTYGDRDLAAYVNRIGQSLGRLSEMPGLPFSFTVLNDDTVNAFALPGGYVHISRGLMALAEDEAEIAGVLAHEIGHIAARHSAQRYSQAVAANIGLTLLGVLGSAYGVPADVGQLASFGAQAWLQSYSREQELEADKLGIRYLARAGYDPTAMTSFLAKMQQHGELHAALAGRPGAVDQYNIMSTHPRTIDRVRQAMELARVRPAGQPRRNRDRYLSLIDGMVFGDDPKAGVRRGRQFAHPDLGIRFEVPPGFFMFNGRTQVVARGPDEALIVFDLAPANDARANKDMAAYLTRMWAPRLNLADVERVDVNGLASATGRASLGGNKGPRDARFVALRGGPERIYRLLFITPRQVTGRYLTAFQRTTFSFRRLAAVEALAIKPLRLRIASVGRGDTVDSLADTLPFETYRREWFLVLNGLRPTARLTPGRTVKLVTD